MTEENSTFGVQSLIDRLSEEGVAEGRRRGDAIVHEAQGKADEIIQSARSRAKALLDEAREEAAQLKSAGDEALRLAARDAVRDLGARIHGGFRNRLQSLIRAEVERPEILQQMIREVVRQSTEDVGDEPVELLIPRQAISEDEARRRLEAGETDVLTDFVRALLSEDLREGLTVDLGERVEAGMALRVVDENVEIDLSPDAISELLALHLLPRFRAIMRHR